MTEAITTEAITTEAITTEAITTEAITTEAITAETITTETIFQTLQAMRARRPLVHNITNYVAMSVSANVLLALGASPAMVHATEEVEDFVGISDALVVNIGTLSPPWVAAMHRAVARATALGKPFVLDPVGCGATPYRTQVSAALAAKRPAIVRGNASGSSACRALRGPSRASIRPRGPTTRWQRPARWRDRRVPSWR